VRRAPAACYLDHDRLHFPGSPFGLDEATGPARRVAWEHQTERRLPPPHIARRLGLEPGVDWVVCTTYLLTADAEPAQLATSYEPDRLIAGTPVALPEQGPLAGRGVIERMASLGIRVDEVTEELSLRPSLRAEAAALAMGPGAPALVIERTHLASGQPVEVGEIVIAADRFRLRYRIPVP
jgi:DNA-binding GntR family transcriptional regulator